MQKQSFQNIFAPYEIKVHRIVKTKVRIIVIHGQMTMKIIGTLSGSIPGNRWFSGFLRQVSSGICVIFSEKNKITKKISVS